MGTIEYSGGAGVAGIWDAVGQESALSESSTKSTPFFITGCLDRFLAESWGWGWLPKTIIAGFIGGVGVLYLKKVTVRERVGAVGVWDGSGEYDCVPPGEVEMSWEFDTMAESLHITQSLSGRTTIYAPSGVTPPDFKGAIGVIPMQNTVEGCDILFPKFEWTEVWRLPRTQVTFAFGQVIANITACTNTNTFRGFPAKSVLFLGATASWSRKDPIYIDFQYKFRLGWNIVNGSTGDSGDASTYITGINKDYWDYIWFSYLQMEDGAAHATVKRATAAYVERIYNSADYSLLLIPTGIPAR